MNNEEYDKLYVVATACNFEGKLLINVNGVFADKEEANRVCESFICNEKLAGAYGLEIGAKTKVCELYKDYTKEFSYVSMDEVMMNAMPKIPYDYIKSFYLRNYNNKGEFEN